MRIKEKTAFASCAKMSDEQSMNGDTQKGIQSCLKIKKEQELNDEPRNSTDCPNISLDYEAVTLSGPRLNCFKGKGVSSDIIQKDSEKEDSSNPNSPNILYSENESICGSGVNVSGSSINNSLSVSTGCASGGRLKFFKDGKFILELSHRKEGEKTCWIPVPKKTYWPVIGTPRQESSTSLSVSDDNSSLQSSPWQRDHCWKQASPRQNINKELEFQLMRPNCMRKLRYTSQSVHAKRRKPSDPIQVDLNCLVRVQIKVRKRTPLEGVIQALWERVLNTCKSEPGIVSPRKRILRELERVTLEEATKRQRARPPARTVSSHSISAILAREDDSVLRTLLRSPSPSPETIRPQQARMPTSPYMPSSSHSLHSGFPPSSTYYPQVPAPYRAPHSLWPVHYPVSSPTLPLPLFPVPPYHNSPWPHIHRSLPQDASPDVPLNLSKHSG